MNSQLATDPHSEHFMHRPLVEVRDLCVQYNNLIALKDISLHLCSREFVAVIGPNGAGKSTLLKAMLGLVTPTSGTVQLTENLGEHAKRALAYLPQQRSLDWSFPISVHDLVMMGRVSHIGFFRRPTKQDFAAAQQAMHDTDTSHLAKRSIFELSGGQKQLVLLARMLARQAQLMLLDEPLTGVDSLTQTRILKILERERAQGKAVLMVTHDLDAAREHCTNMILLNKRVIATGRSEHVYTPENIAATFARASNVE